ncbi:MAG: hypothetical protein M1837_000472 [Sclerophora amabilis]|nr:MAG: hypothetical protein M1837_000472 [Sclerophora amabilis]
MSRPSQPAGRAQPPLNTQLPGTFTSPISPSGAAATSFKTNVNRQKTKRWVEAKSYSYDGDDWGEVDDFDEYGAEQEPPPPPSPKKTTGLRQRGQGVNSSGENFTDAPPPTAPGARKGYGDLEPGPPPGVKELPNPGRGRSNSYELDDDKRTFSTANASRPETDVQDQARNASAMSSNQTSQIPRTSFSQMGVNQGDPRSRHEPVMQPPPALPDVKLHTQGPPQNVKSNPQPMSAGAAPADRANRSGSNPRLMTTGSRTQSMDSDASSVDFQARRDFSPSAVPVPLKSRQSPAPGRPYDTSDPASLRHPPRKSSLSQQTSPYIHSSDGPPLGEGSAAPTIDSATAPDTSRGRERTSSNSKPLPFIRPSDIYKRVEEERERERQSMDSSRPSMDSITGNRPMESDLNSNPEALEERYSSESPGRNSRRRPSLEGIAENEPGRRPKPLLDPVKERRSEYGLDQSSPPKTANTNAPATSGSALAERDNSKPSGMASPGKILKENNESEESQVSPMLPSLSKASHFGADIWSPSEWGQLQPSLPPSSKQSSMPENDNSSPQEPYEPNLQHQGSLGFRSAVNQAFDRTDDQSIPPTPSTTGGSQPSQSGSGPNRSNSASTIGISPILGRNSSTSIAAQKSSFADLRQDDIPAIAEENPDHLTNAAQDATRTTPPQTVHQGSTQSPPHTFKPGHRRDLSTPSPRNSPARTPVLETNNQLQSPQVVDIANTTPGGVSNVGMDTPTSQAVANFDNASSKDFQARDMELGPRGTSSHANRTEGTEEVAQKSSPSRQNSFPYKVVDKRTEGARSSSPIPRAESPSKGSVRSLTDMFEDGHTRSASAQSLLKNERPLDNARSETGDETAYSSMKAEPSFRPTIPGGWVSYATTNDGNTTPLISREDPTVANSTPTKKTDTCGAENDSDDEFEPTPTTAKHSLAAPPAKNPFESSQLSHTRGPTYQSNSMGNNESVPPTPPPKDAPVSDDLSKSAPQYFPYSPMPLKQKPRSPAASPDPTPLNHSKFQPSLSTEASPQDQESDRLRKEIVKSLTPPVAISESSGLKKPLSTSEDQSILAGSGEIGPGSETTFIPSEYQNYWASTQPDQGPASSSQNREAPNQDGGASATSSEGAGIDDDADNSKPSQASKTIFDPKPALLHKRYSWDQETENNHATASQGLPNPSDDHIYTAPEPQTGTIPGTQGPHLDSRQRMETREAYSSGPEGPSSPYGGPGCWSQHSGAGPMSNVPEKDHLQLIGRETSSETPSDYQPHHIDTSVDSSIARDFRNMPIDEVAHDGMVFNGDSQGSNIDEKHRPGFGGQRADPYASPLEAQPTGTPPPYQHTDANDGEVHTGVADQRYEEVGASNDRLEAVSPKPMAEPTRSPITATYAQPQVPGLKEILAMKSPAERIDTYNNARHQFAILDHGLSQWIAVTTSQIPEHSSLLSGSGHPNNPANVTSGSGRHKISLMTSTASAGQNPQQPYYQQYLNFSNSPVSNSSASASQAAQSSAPPSQGFSPSGTSGGRTSSLHVQAKGKELLHNAGMFGGKANVAAKGLFAKSKSRFRGGGDKGLSDSPDVSSTSPPAETFRGGALDVSQPNTLPDKHGSSKIQITTHAMDPGVQDAPDAPDTNPRSSRDRFYDVSPVSSSIGDHGDGSISSTHEGFFDAPASPLSYSDSGSPERHPEILGSQDRRSETALHEAAAHSVPLESHSRRFQADLLQARNTNAEDRDGTDPRSSKHSLPVSFMSSNHEQARGGGGDSLVAQEDETPAPKKTLAWPGSGSTEKDAASIDVTALGVHPAERGFGGDAEERTRAPVTSDQPPPHYESEELIERRYSSYSTRSITPPNPSPCSFTPPMPSPNLADLARAAQPFAMGCEPAQANNFTVHSLDEANGPRICDSPSPSIGSSSISQLEAHMLHPGNRRVALNDDGRMEDLQTSSSPSHRRSTPRLDIASNLGSKSGTELSPEQTSAQFHSPTTHDVSWIGSFEASVQPTGSRKDDSLPHASGSSHSTVDVRNNYHDEYPNQDWPLAPAFHSPNDARGEQDYYVPQSNISPSEARMSPPVERAAFEYQKDPRSPPDTSNDTVTGGDRAYDTTAGLVSSSGSDSNQPRTEPSVAGPATPGVNPAITHSKVKRRSGLFQSLRSEGFSHREKSSSRNQKWDASPGNNAALSVEELSKASSPVNPSGNTLIKGKRNSLFRSSNQTTRTEKKPFENDLHMAETGHVSAKDHSQNEIVGLNENDRALITEVPFQPVDGGNTIDTSGGERANMAKIVNSDDDADLDENRSKVKKRRLSGLRVRYPQPCSMILCSSIYPMQDLFNRSGTTHPSSKPAKTYHRADAYGDSAQVARKPSLPPKEPKPSRKEHLSSEGLSSYDGVPINGYYAPQKSSSTSKIDATDPYSFVGGHRLSRLQDKTEQSSPYSQRRQSDHRRRASAPTRRVGSSPLQQVKQERTAQDTHGEPQYEAQPIPLAYQQNFGDAILRASYPSSPNVTPSHGEFSHGQPGNHHRRHQSQDTFPVYNLHSASPLASPFSPSVQPTSPQGISDLSNGNTASNQASHQFFTHRANSHHNSSRPTDEAYDAFSYSPIGHPRQQTPWNLSIPDESAEEAEEIHQAHERSPPQPPKKDKGYNFPAAETREVKVTAPLSDELPKRPSPHGSFPQAWALKPLPPPPVPSKSPLQTHPLMSNDESNGFIRRNPGKQNLATPDMASLSSPMVPPVRGGKDDLAIKTHSIDDYPSSSKRKAETASSTETMPQNTVERPTLRLQGIATGEGPSKPANGQLEHEDSDEIVMSPTSYPGQEWYPSGFGKWNELTEVHDL